jgi:hypothetical protein
MDSCSSSWVGEQTNRGHQQIFVSDTSVHCRWMPDKMLKYRIPQIYMPLTLSSDEESPEASLAWEETLSSTALQFVEMSVEDESHFRLLAGYRDHSRCRMLMHWWPAFGTCIADCCSKGREAIEHKLEVCNREECCHRYVSDSQILSQR